MTLLESIEQYVIHKRSSGCRFAKGAQYLRALCGCIGDRPIDEISAQQISTYLDRPNISNNTWLLRFHIVEAFFRYWVARRAVKSSPMPHPRSPVPQRFVPYVYTHIQLRAILVAVAQLPMRHPRKLHPKTIRAILIFLYATGSSVQEVLDLLLADIDLHRQTAKIGSSRGYHLRTIPLGHDLCVELRKYVAWRLREKQASHHLFITRDGRRVSYNTMRENFHKLCCVAEVSRNDGSGCGPRMDDLRYTFAVDRITSWIRGGAILNRMLPALAAYMGQVGLGATGRYLAMTPERFRRQLHGLSAAHRRGMWRDDQDLMLFLKAL